MNDPVPSHSTDLPQSQLNQVSGSDNQGTPESIWPATDLPKPESGRTTPELPDPGAWGFPTVPGYVVLGELGVGGMGVVYKARQVQLDRVVALKMIKAGAGADREDLQRFRSEAQSLARLQHPNIVQVYEIGEYNGQPFFSLEFCPGGSLDRRIKRTPQPPREAAALLQTLALALHASHEAKVIHRDLKPANVLLLADGTPKVTDFGLARKLDDVGHTQTGAIMGTPNYMAPEQAQGLTGQIGPSADTYALGAMLYELLTGRPPFGGATVLETLRQVQHEEPVPPSRLVPGLDRDLDPGSGNGLSRIGRFC